jgi:hypothetical protein
MRAIQIALLKFKCTNVRTEHTFTGEQFLPRVPYRLRLVIPADCRC